jgi:hypothetical protein
MIISKKENKDVSWDLQEGGAIHGVDIRIN